MKTLYVGGNSSVKLSQGTTQRFYLKRGVRQGCAVSVYLFLIVAQAFSHFIKSSELEGIQVEGRSVLISQLASHPSDQHVVHYITIIKNIFGKLNSFLQTYMI